MYIICRITDSTGASGVMQCTNWYTFILRDNLHIEEPSFISTLLLKSDEDTHKHHIHILNLTLYIGYQMLSMMTSTSTLLLPNSYWRNNRLTYKHRATSTSGYTTDLERKNILLTKCITVSRTHRCITPSNRYYKQPEKQNSKSWQKIYHLWCKWYFWN